MNSGTYENENLRNRKEFGSATQGITFIFYDGEVILGEGINRLYLIDQVRLEEIKTIKRVLSGIDNEIFIETLSK